MIRLVVTHVPTGYTVFGKRFEKTKQRQGDFEAAAEEIATGRVHHLKFQNSSGDFVYIPEEILKESILKVESDQ